MQLKTWVKEMRKAHQWEAVMHCNVCNKDVEPRIKVRTSGYGDYRHCECPQCGTVLRKMTKLKDAIWEANFEEVKRKIAEANKSILAIN